MQQAGLHDFGPISLSQYLHILKIRDPVLTIEDRTREAFNASEFASKLAGELPLGFSGTLYPYQAAGYRWLAYMRRNGLGCIIADEMGLGKTIQALALLLKEKERGITSPSLVVAPTSVVPNWEAEVELHAPGLTKLRYHGAQREKLHKEFDNADLVITSYAILRRDAEILCDVDWNFVVLDEAQAIKNAATMTARTTRKLKARRRLALTGTLLENHLGELWSHFQFAGGHSG